MIDIYIITDYRNKLYSSTKYWDASLDLKTIEKLFFKNQFKVIWKSLGEVADDLVFYKNKIVIYPSSEDPGMIYKSFIEDVVYALDEVNANLIPSFSCLKAHHNKVSMELFRKIHLSNEFNIPKSFVFGTYEDYLNDINIFKGESWVIKPSSGALSKGVKLLRTDDDKIKIPKRTSNSLNYLDKTKVFIKHILKSRYVDYRKKSTHRNKFLLQKFIPNLAGDFKILIYGTKYYVVERKNRKNDFRASGGGNINTEPMIPEGLLDYAHLFFKEVNVPYASIDIAYDGKTFYLIEFQFMHFGNFSLEKSTRFYQLSSNSWEVIEEKSVLENEFVNSIILYLNATRN